METKKIIVAVIIIIILIIGIWYFFGLNINPINRSMSVDVFVLKKFDGQQSFEIEKPYDKIYGLEFSGEMDCRDEFLKRNPTFNNTPYNTGGEGYYGETYYCNIISTSFDKTEADEFSGRQSCSCFYKK